MNNKGIKKFFNKNKDYSTQKTEQVYQGTIHLLGEVSKVFTDIRKRKREKGALLDYRDMEFMERMTNRGDDMCDRIPTLNKYGPYCNYDLSKKIHGSLIDFIIEYLRLEHPSVKDIILEDNTDDYDEIVALKKDNYIKDFNGIDIIMKLEKLILRINDYDEDYKIKQKENKIEPHLNLSFREKIIRQQGELFVILYFFDTEIAKKRYTVWVD